MTLFFENSCSTLQFLFDIFYFYSTEPHEIQVTLSYQEQVIGDERIQNEHGCRVYYGDIFVQKQIRYSCTPSLSDESLFGSPYMQQVRKTI